MGSLLSTSQPDPGPKSEAQFAMESSCFCVICGSPFSPEGEVYNLDVRAARYKWMRNHRLLGSRQDVHHHNLAGLSAEEFHSACYNASDSADVFLSAATTWNATNDQLFHIDEYLLGTDVPGRITFNAMQQIGNYDTVFPLHENCLQISRRVIDQFKPMIESDDGLSSLSTLNKMLQSRYRQNARCTNDNSIVAKNDLFDLCTATGTHGPRSVVGLSLLEWWEGAYEKFYTDPINIPTLTVHVFGLLQDTSGSAPCPYPFSLPCQGSCGIDQLPVELIDQISIYLPAHSALALHQTSKTLASKLILDNNFWRRSIMSGTALPYLWDLNTNELEKLHRERIGKSSRPDATWDWKAIGQLLATKYFALNSSDPRTSSLPNGLWNRRRIWSIVEEAYRHDYPNKLDGDQINSVVGERKRCEPVLDWQLEEIMDDLGHYS
ncbi:uncharacterized protein EKO05_0009061 [Ascochyta rabiei]|uniref:uncharacterized protein n=1 Tax=Didymella rabiei TaxID=5454 RepID=UPI0018FF17AE|nr:uncharacterized protein EKO05_0009061 [Ascochyta rabiei]UPX18770.1 hypothetical protein EKO05_0009061 [Ascochyta rabiei]